MAKSKPKAKAMTKAALLGELSERTELKKTQINAVFEALEQIITAELKKVGSFTVPGLVRLKLTRKPAVKGGEKKINPLTKQEYVTAPKPAYNKVSVSAVKSIKEAVK